VSAGEVVYIFDFDLHDHELDYEPHDPHDFEFWMTVNVGDGRAGNYFQVHVCTPVSIGRIPNKRGVFLVQEWSGVEPLVAEMNAFIRTIVAKAPWDDPYEVLSKVWLWEYSGMG